MLAKGQGFVLNDVVASRFEAYDSLPKLYQLYTTLSRDPKLAEFSFILTWPKFKDAEKRSLYSKFACHELNFFLWKKDRAFFATVVKPYLANKKDKTFLDHWLLGDDVARYMEPWRHGRLNVVERVLLSRRIAGETDRTARHLGDLFAILPPRIERDILLFDTAVQTSDLAVESETISGRSGSAKARMLRREAVNAVESTSHGRPRRRRPRRTVRRMAGSCCRQPRPMRQRRRRCPRPKPSRSSATKPTSLVKDEAKAARVRVDGRDDGEGSMSRTGLDARRRPTYYFEQRPQAGRRSPTVPQARPDHGVGREQLLQAPHRRAARRTRHRQPVLGRLRQAHE